MPASTWGPGHPVQLLDLGLERRLGVAQPLADQAADGGGLDDDAQLVEVVELLGRELAHEEAAVGQVGDQPRVLEQPRRLAHRRPADAELPRHDRFGEPLAGGQLAGHDGLAQPPRDALDKPLAVEGCKAFVFVGVIHKNHHEECIFEVKLIVFLPIVDNRLDQRCKIVLPFDNRQQKDDSHA
jgi:hypothetical protein